MIHDVKLLYRFLVIAWKRLAYYKFNFILLLLYWTTSLILLIVFWNVLFQFLPDSIEEWDFPKLVILNSFCYISWGIFTIFWGFAELPNKVVEGQLDKYLARPMNLLTGVIGDGFHLEALYEIMTGIIAILVIYFKYNLNINLLNWINAIIVLGLGSIALVLFHATLALLSFWWGRIHHLQNFIQQFDDFQRYPIDFFPKGAAIFFKFIIPLYFPSTMAAKIFFGIAIDYINYLYLFIVISTWAAGYAYFYSLSIKRYESHGG